MDRDIVDFPRDREVIVDAGRLAARRHVVHGLLEVDVTIARTLLRAAKERGEDLSFTAFLIASYARAIAATPRVQAYRDWRGRLWQFHDVDVSTLVEAVAGTAAIPHIVREANRKTVIEISREIRSVQARPESSEQKGDLAALGARAPRVARDAFFWAMRKNPEWFRRIAGTTIVTSVGMFGRGGGWGIGFLPLHTLGLTVGGISEKPRVVDAQVAVRQVLNLTLSFDHDIVDGAPGARLARSLVDIIESASLLA